MKKDMFFNCPTGEATEGGEGGGDLKSTKTPNFPAHFNGFIKSEDTQTLVLFSCFLFFFVMHILFKGGWGVK